MSDDADVVRSAFLLEEAGNLVHIATGNTESGVMAANGVGVGRFKQAVHMTTGIVEQFDLTDAELVVLAVLGFLGDLLDCLIGQLEIIVEIHELWH
ncbi:MAG: hypothetical protein WA786_01465 [Acidimicrobiales bacterium]|jgi:hypothetical protein